MNLRTRLGVLFFCFLALVSISVATTAYVVDDQDEDATVINQAGRQRMLLQRIAVYSLQLGRGEDDPADRQMIADSREMFGETLHALSYGGETHYLSGQMVELPATGSSAIRTQLREIELTWQPYSAAVSVLLAETPGTPAFETALDTV